MRARVPILAVAFLFLVIAWTTLACAEGTWWNGFRRGPAYAPGVNGEVISLGLYDGHLILGGAFRDAGGIPVSYVTSFDGTVWGRLGRDGGTNDNVEAQALYGGDLYVAGTFTRADWEAWRVARWNGERWYGVGGGANGPVHALAVYDGKLILGGEFSSAGSVGAFYIVAWDGTSYTPLGDMRSLNGGVNALTVYNGELIVGGDFDEVGSTPSPGVARWNGTSWNTLGGGVSGGPHPQVSSLAVRGGYLYVGGIFSSAGGVAASNLARWDGTQFADLRGGTNGPVRVIHSSTSGLYIGGDFTIPAGHVARWDNVQWNPLGTGTDAPVLGLTTWSGMVVAGGSFLHAGDLEVSHVAGWDGSAWRELGDPVPQGQGLSTYAQAMVLHDGGLIVGGSFQSAGDVPVHGVARWDGSSWSPVGSLLYVEALLSDAGILYATSSGHAYRWDGGAWVQIGTEYLGAELPALAVFQGVLYAGGSEGLFRWLGGTWVDMGIEGKVYALREHEGSLFATGSFQSASGIPAHGIAAFDGNGWRSVGGGLSGAAGYVLTEYNGALVVGGYFTGAGDVSAENIASWDGVHWRSLGSGTNVYVRGLTVFNGDLIAGGDFYIAGGHPAKRIARWDGTDWSALGSGLERGIEDFPDIPLVPYGGDLYAAGNLQWAGDIPTSYIARWIEGTSDAPERPDLAKLTLCFPNPYRRGAPIRCTGGRGLAGGLDVYSIDGRRVRHLEGGIEVRWDGRTDLGAEAPAGIYAIVARSGGAGERRKILLLE